MAPNVDPAQLTREECMHLLASARIGRVILTEQALPTALPVAYAIDAGDVVFRSAAGAKLSAARQGTVIAFEVDAFDEATRTGWSVVVTGMAGVVSDPAQQLHADGLDIPAWVDPSGSRHIRLVPTLVTGRRISVAPA
jgi:nitroimidazol reductase NimA-like FMN-containing flavoprotein (pyridoxamine 5'-phosphate oxidase superfamily)